MGLSKSILLQPVGSVPDNVLRFLQESLAKQFDDCTFSISPTIEIPSHAFDERRNQYRSTIVLDWLDKHVPYDKILGICDFDAYAEDLNFVFGQAQRGGRVLAIYLPRLRQEFYGFKPDVSLSLQRAAKEAVHELGHSFGLGHCRLPSCVMYFSNSLRDTDKKGKEFCSGCKSAMASKY
jgi:archaemetzincin